jgi:hypothetical protein
MPNFNQSSPPQWLYTFPLSHQLPQPTEQHGYDQHTAAVISPAKETPKEGEKYHLTFSAEFSNPAT